MKQKIFLLSILGLGVCLMSCGSQANTPTNIPTDIPTLRSSGNRTVVARPEVTDTPAAAITVIISNSPGETSDAPTGLPIVTEPPEPTDVPQDTPSAPVGTSTPEPIANDETPLPTAEIERPLLPTTAPAGAPTTVPQQAGIGTPIAFGAASVTVTGIQSSQGGEGDVPRPGNQYLVVPLHLENNGSKNLTFDASQFSVKAADGTIIAYDDVNFVDNILRTAILAPGAKRDVVVVFQTPNGATGLTLVLGDPASSLATVKLN